MSHIDFGHRQQNVSLTKLVSISKTQLYPADKDVGEKTLLGFKILVTFDICLRNMRRLSHIQP